MGIVAVPAIYHRRVYVQVRLCEAGSLRVVAFPAQGLYGLTQQGILGGHMRRVTPRAIPGRRLVGLFLLHPGFHILVATHTQIRTFRQEQAWQFALVRVVACCTVRGFEGLVFALRSLCLTLQI